jgi:hypothetical protein
VLQAVLGSRNLPSGRATKIISVDCRRYALFNGQRARRPNDLIPQVKPQAVGHGRLCLGYD